MKRYRRCVGLVVINIDGLVFVGKRIDSNLNAWQMPQGGIENGESPRNAGLREMKEEIGTNNVKLIGEMDNWLNYDIPQKLSSKLYLSLSLLLIPIFVLNLLVQSNQHHCLYCLH